MCVADDFEGFKSTPSSIILVLVQHSRVFSRIVNAVALAWHTKLLSGELQTVVLIVLRSCDKAAWCGSGTTVVL